MELVPPAPHPVWLVPDLVQIGFSAGDVAAMRRTGALQRLRRSAYAARPPTDAAEAHRLLITATLRLVTPEACLSHVSAALMHRLPWWADSLDRVHVTRRRAAGGRQDAQIHVHPALLEATDVVEIEGLRTTSLARTVADCARTMPFRRGVALGDAALRQGMDPEELVDQLRRAAGRVGVARARRVAAFLDARAESVGESESRVVLHELRLPSPDLQVVVRDPSGRFVGRCDFGWSKFRTLGEFDGRVKYGRLLGDGRDAGQAVYDEKLREDELRGLGNEMVRWCGPDLTNPARLRARLLSAFARGSRS